MSTTHVAGYPIVRSKESIHVTGRRVVATLIDGLILGAAYNFLTLLFGDITNPRPWQWIGLLDNIVANILYGVAVVAYFVMMEGYLGQTFGKMVMGIAVIREDGSGPPGVGAALIRTVLRIVDSLLGYTVAFVTVLISDKRQRLGDMAARTLVVRK